MERRRQRKGKLVSCGKMVFFFKRKNGFFSVKKKKKRKCVGGCGWMILVCVARFFVFLGEKFSCGILSEFRLGESHKKQCVMQKLHFTHFVRLCEKHRITHFTSSIRAIILVLEFYPNVLCGWTSGVTTI